jgi:hypothetical protein
MADAHFGDLAGATGHRILMTPSSRRLIEDRPKSVSGRVFHSFEDFLIQSEVSPAGSDMPLPALWEPGLHNHRYQSRPVLRSQR